MTLTFVCECFFQMFTLPGLAFPHSTSLWNFFEIWNRGCSVLILLLTIGFPETTVLILSMKINRTVMVVLFIFSMYEYGTITKLNFVFREYSMSFTVMAQSPKPLQIIKRTVLLYCLVFFCLQHVNHNCQMILYKLTDFFFNLYCFRKPIWYWQQKSSVSLQYVLIPLVQYYCFLLRFWLCSSGNCALELNSKHCFGVTDRH